MNFADLVGQKLGKRMVAFCWSIWMIGQTTDLNQQIMIAVLAIGYMTCQTISDREEKRAAK